MPSLDLRLEDSVIRFDTSVLPTMEPGLFEAKWLRSHQIWQSSIKGRSEAHFFHYAGRDMVLRHFQRGGLVGRVNRDLYLRTGAANSRALREFDLLAEMHSSGLPVPIPVAARYVPWGPFYRADIITQRIPNAHPLQDVLAGKALSSQLWQAAGASIRKLHEQGVFHSDLNCRNILIDQSEKFWFIDFDKCEKRTPGAWSKANLDRLLRSLRKTKANLPSTNWQETDWTDLLSGYDGR